MVRFLPETRCWKFTGPKDGTGYGLLYLDNKELKAHKVFYEVFEGPIPAGKYLQHYLRTPQFCAGRARCNPVRLQLGDSPVMEPPGGGFVPPPQAPAMYVLPPIPQALPIEPIDPGAGKLQQFVPVLLVLIIVLLVVLLVTVIFLLKHEPPVQEHAGGARTGAEGEHCRESASGKGLPPC